MECEMCGSKNAEFRALVEEIPLNVCIKCSKHGKVLGSAKIIKKELAVKKIKHVKEEPQESIVQNYSVIIRTTREKLKLSQEDFAKKINEKLSLIHNMERGKIAPSIDLARKLEKLLKIKLVEIYKEEDFKSSQKSEKYTIGDFIKVR